MMLLLPMPISRTQPRPATPEAITELILRIFRANGALLLAGDRLVAPLGLTSARWQLLGGMVAAASPKPVVQLARDIGVSRQAVQRLANDLEREGIVAFERNPRHKRAQLVVPTARGRELFDAALAMQRPWAAKLRRNLSAAQVEAAGAALEGLVDALYAQASAAEASRVNSA